MKTKLRCSDACAVGLCSHHHCHQLAAGGAVVNLSFTTEFGFPHHLESKDALGPGSWTAFGPLAITGSGGVTGVSDTRLRSPTDRFCRVVMSP